MSNTPAVAQLMSTFSAAETQYRLTGEEQYKEPADRARAAITDYIRELEAQTTKKQEQINTYVQGRAGSGSELDTILGKIEKVKQDSRTIATDYLVANDFNQPMPIDWTKYYIKFAVLGGLVSGIALLALTR